MIMNNLNDLFHYNSLTGLIYWKKDYRKVKVGSVAGHKNKFGYIKIGINYKIYAGHRIAWFLYYGKWPENYIDHINGIKDDNRIENLRDVTKRQNNQNRKETRENKLSLGTSFLKSRNRWQAQITIKNKNHRLGYYKTQIEAHNAYMAKLKDLGENALVSV